MLAECGAGAGGQRELRSGRDRGCWAAPWMQFPLSPQVSRFLAAAWRAPDFVPRYCKLYGRLQRAGSELFGPRAAFMLALRSGFSGALLQQSFLTAAHVSAGDHRLPSPFLLCLFTSFHPPPFHSTPSSWFAAALRVAPR